MAFQKIWTSFRSVENQLHYSTPNTTRDDSVHFLPADIRNIPRNWWFLSWCSKEQQHRVEHVTEMDVEFNCLSNDNRVFSAVENQLHYSASKTMRPKNGCKNDKFSIRQKMERIDRPQFTTNRMLNSVAYLPTWTSLSSVENQLSYSTPNTKKRCQNDVFQSLEKIFFIR